MNKHVFEKVAFIGLGLIAGSMALALRRLPQSIEIYGFAQSEKTRNRVREIGFCDQVFDQIEDAVKDADLIVICTPLGVMSDIAQAIAAHLKPGAIVTDVGSTKRAVIDAIEPFLPPHVGFVPAHPLAGTENSGPDAGFASLFDGRWCILTPAIRTSTGDIEAVKDFWSSIGAKVSVMEADHHDLVLAVTSHVPHLIAFTMVGVADDLSRVTESEVIEYSAAGFRDFTRIASSDPTMWRDVFLSNKDATIEILDKFTDELSELKAAIMDRNGQKLFDYFTHTRQIRRSILEIGQDVNLPDFGRSTITKEKDRA